MSLMRIYAISVAILAASSVFATTYYVNGDNNLENLKAPDDTWKVRLIEEDFHRLMFDVEDM